MVQKKHLLIFVLLFSLGLLVSACSPNEAEAEHMEEDMDEHMDEDMDEHMDDEHSDDEHTDGEHMEGMDHMHYDPPEEYADLENPYDEHDEEALAAGEEIFQTNCVVCHGEEGRGDGPSAEALDPHPADLGDNMMMMELSDGYLFWRVSEGGLEEPFNSAMPAWGLVLTEEQRWQVITYVRSFSDEH